MGDFQRAAGGVIAAVKEVWNGLEKVGATSWPNRKALVMPNGISARYQGKAYDSTCAERVHFMCQIRWYRRRVKLLS